MPRIHLETAISAPVQRCFDLARSVDAHVASAAQTGEVAVGGVTKGLLGLGDEVTWEAVHFGVRQRLRVRMTQLDAPRSFTDEMVEGIFRRMRHVHTFDDVDARTLMTDEFEFEAPLGLLGRMAETLVLTRYMRRFLQKRNEVLKSLAESGAL